MRKFTPEEKELIVNTPITEDVFDIEGIEKIMVGFNHGVTVMILIFIVIAKIEGLI